MRLKLREWCGRYLIAEFVGLILTILVSNLTFLFFNNLIFSAVLGTWADNLGFYGTIIYRDVKKRKNSTGMISLVKLFRNVIIEFGPAEYLDSFLIRPFYLTVIPSFISNYSLAIIIGSVLANITYYIPTIIGYETRKKLFKD